MSETPSVPSWGKRKIAGIPVLYLAIGFVIVLVAIAWNMKSAPKEPVADVATDSGAVDMDNGSGDLYPAPPVGTVVAAPTPVDTSGNTSIDSNDEWLRRGVMYLAESGTSPGEAHMALSLYLDGAELSWDQGAMRDKVIRELGMPPYPVLVGGTRPDVARRQGAVPRNHTVKNVYEDGASELARLYYNRTDAFAIKAIADANGGQTAWNVGDSVRIPTLPTPATVPAKPPTKPAVPVKPAATPARYYTVKSGDTLSGIAKRYYGDAGKYMVIAKANKISNPNLIHPGQRLLIP